MKNINSWNFIFPQLFIQYSLQILKEEKKMYDYAKFMAELERKNPAQPEFIQAAGEIIASVIDTVNSNPLYLKNKILDRITEPDRVITFKVEWEDDDHNIQVNRGYRV